MTFLEKVKKDNPNIKLKDSGAPMACPFELGYEEDYDCEEVTCINCWNREIPGTEPNVVNVGELMDRTYEQGLNDAWELALKTYRMNCDRRKAILGELTYDETLESLSPQEALAKLKAYEETQIEVGDVVTTVNGECPYIVTNVQLPNTLHVINSRNGYAQQIRIDVCKKTGKHLNVQQFLKQIGE